MPNALKRTLFGCVAVLTVAGVAWSLATPETPLAPPPKAVPVRAITVAAQDVPRTVMGLGTVLSLHSVTIRPQVDGVLTRIAVKEGQWVARGELLATIDDRSIRANLEQAQAQLGQSKAQLQVARLDLKRYQALSQDNGISRQVLDQQQALFDQLTATRLGQEAAIAAATVQLSYTRIHSPVAGRVGIRNIDEGNFLRVSDAAGLFSVTQIDPIAVEFALPQQYLPTLQTLLDQPEPAAIKAYANGDSSTGVLLGEGRLALLDNQVTSATGTLRAKAEFSNPQRRLWPGQLVNVVLQTALERQVLAVAPQVVQRGLEGYFVYRLKGEEVESVPVSVRYQTSQLTVIDGVRAGDVLIIDGQSRLKPGSRVRVLEDAPPTAPAA